MIHSNIREKVRQFGHLDAIIIMMRTTVNLPEDVYEVARSLASAKRISLGEALAQLIRRGLVPEARIVENPQDFPCFSVSRHAAPITLEQTLDAEDQP